LTHECVPNVLKLNSNVNKCQPLLGGNKLTSVPAELGNLTALQTLDLRSNNDLTSVPAELGRLTNLASLDLAYCELTSFPAELGKVVQVDSFKPGARAKAWCLLIHAESSLFLSHFHNPS